MNRGPMAQRREAYRRYVEAGAREGLESTGVWADLKEGCLLGSRRFIAQVREHLSGDGGEQKAAARLQRDRPTWSQIIAAVEKAAGAPWETLRSRHGDTTRDLALYLGRRHGAMKLRELAAAAGLGQYGAVAMAVKRYENKLAQDRAERRRCNAIAQMLNVKM